MNPKDLAQQKRQVIADIADALTDHASPPMDGRLKSIVASAIGHLLKGGYDYELIRHTAIELALTDMQLLPYLMARVRVAQSVINEGEHIQRMHKERRDLERSLPNVGLDQIKAYVAERGGATAFLDQLLARRRGTDALPAVPESGRPLERP